MASTFDDHPPDNNLHVPDEEAHIAAAIDEARENLAMLFYVQQFPDRDEPVDLIEEWTDTVYNRLRSRLSREMLVRAVLTLLADDAWAMAQRIRFGACPSDEQVRDTVGYWVDQGYGQVQR